MSKLIQIESFGLSEIDPQVIRKCVGCLKNRLSVDAKPDEGAIAVDYEDWFIAYFADSLGKIVRYPRQCWRFNVAKTRDQKQKYVDEMTDALKNYMKNVDNRIINKDHCCFDPKEFIDIDEYLKD